MVRSKISQILGFKVGALKNKSNFAFQSNYQ